MQTVNWNEIKSLRFTIGAFRIGVPCSERPALVHLKILQCYWRSSGCLTIRSMVSHMDFLWVITYKNNVWVQAQSLFDEVKLMDSSTASAFYNALTDVLWHFGQGCLWIDAINLCTGNEEPFWCCPSNGSVMVAKYTLSCVRRPWVAETVESAHSCPRSMHNVWKYAQSHHPFIIGRQVNRNKELSIIS